MIVTVIADVLGEENNGTTTACMNLIRYLRSQGDEVRVVCCDQGKKDEPGYYVVRTRRFGPIASYIIKKNNVSLAHVDKKVLARAIEGADIVHIMLPFALGKAGLKIAKRLGIPVTAGFHCQAENFTSHIGMMSLNLASHFTYQYFYKGLYEKVDGVHYPTEFIKDTFEKDVRHTTNAYVISNGVGDIFRKKDVSKPEELKDKFVILFTGRYSKEKSHKILIKAVSKSKYKEKIQLIFAGQGPKKGSLEKCSKKCHINMPIMKFYKKEDLVDVINYSDLYCHPAEIEIEAIACLEAISCGLVPVIADSKKCATKAFALDDKNLFRCNDYRDLANKIDYWIEHPEEKEKRSLEYLGYTKRFNQKECMTSMRQMMIDCIRDSKNA